MPYVRLFWRTTEEAHVPYVRPSLKDYRGRNALPLIEGLQRRPMYLMFTFYWRTEEAAHVPNVIPYLKDYRGVPRYRGFSCTLCSPLIEGLQRRLMYLMFALNWGVTAKEGHIPYVRFLVELHQEDDIPNVHPCRYTCRGGSCILDSPSVGRFTKNASAVSGRPGLKDYISAGRSGGQREYRNGADRPCIHPCLTD